MKRIMLMHEYLTKLALFLLMSTFSLTSFAAPKADLWPYWDVSNAQNSVTLDHSRWQAILDRNLLKKGSNTLFQYRSMSQQDKNLLKSYIQSLTAQDPRQLNKDQQFAYWVNLYNALTVQLILDNYPIKSITKLGGLFAFGPWDQDITVVNGQTLTLNDIEHRILRPIWQDKRIHYAVNCASLGCPNLSQQAFTASNHEQLLTQAEQAFIQSPKGVHITDNQLQLSSIFDWYAVDFGGEADVLEYLSTFRPEINNTNKKPSYGYNWALNE